MPGKKNKPTNLLLFAAVLAPLGAWADATTATIGTINNQSMTFAVGTTVGNLSEAMRITSGSLMVIGGAALTGKAALTISGTSDLTNGILISGTTTDAGQLEWRTAGTPRHYNIDQNTSSGAPQLRLFSEDNSNDGNGKLELLIISSSMSIGTLANPTTALDVSGTVKASNGFTGDGSALTNVPSDGCSPNNVQTFTTVGSGNTWTKPACGKMAFVECWGGGGGGAGGKYLIIAGTGGGGGGGAYVSRLVPLSTMGATETVTVGAGGSGGASTPTDGNDGGTSSVGSIVVAPGGGGGGYGSPGDGWGGKGAGDGGDGGETTATGGNGGCGGGGGASGKSNSPGSSPCGGDGGGSSSGSNGSVGTAPGGGGGGGAATSSGQTKAGGAGAKGQCKVTVI